MKKDILFFDPPQINDAHGVENYALLWIASYLKKRGVNTRVYYLDHDFKATIRKALAQYHPRYVAVSCKWYPTLYSSILVAEEIRKIDKTIKIIAGGNTAAYFDKELLLNSEFDIVIRGDAELPLLNIINNGTPINCTIKKNGRIKRHKLQYIQGEQTVKDHILVEPAEILEAPEDLLSGKNFVWTGKGCTQNCFYCAGASGIQKKMFGRGKLLYRPVRNVLRDIAILSKYSKSLLFDFACPPHADPYYVRVFKGIPHGKFSLTFFHWSLPSKSLIDQMSEIFKSVQIHIDTSTLCEELRATLTRENLLKPFFSNNDLERIICYANKKKNIKIIMENIAGLKGERECHVTKHIGFAQYLIRKYVCIKEISYIPLSVEPGSSLQKNYKRLKMHCSRNSFKDFLNLTKYAFKNNMSYPFSGFFHKDNHKFDPYGVCQNNHSTKSSYSRDRRFHDIMANEFLINEIVRHNKRDFSAPKWQKVKKK